MEPRCRYGLATSVRIPGDDLAPWRKVEEFAALPTGFQRHLLSLSYESFGHVENAQNPHGGINFADSC